MKTQLITTLAVAAIGIVLAGCRTVGDGVAEQKTFAGMQVEAIEITGPWTVEMNCGARENSVTVTVEQNLWKYVSIRTGRKFRLALDKDVSFTLPLKLTVNSTGNLSKADLKGSVNATVFNNKAQLFTLNLEDLCKFRGDNSAISIVNCDMEGNTVALFTGSISDLKLEAEENTIFRGGSITAATLNLNDKALVTLEEVGSLSTGRRSPTAEKGFRRSEPPVRRRSPDNKASCRIVTQPERERKHCLSGFFDGSPKTPG